jgi:hypothetical protein
MDPLWYLLQGKDYAALLFAAGLGYLAGMFVPHGWPSIYVSILVSYHLFLAWLLLTNERKAAVPISAFYSIGTHLSCMTIILALGLTRSFIPNFDLVCCCFAGLAFFERNWLFRDV